MKKAFKVKLHPNNVQQTKMFEMADAARFAYNYTVEKQMDKERNHENFLDDKTIRKNFTQYKKLDENKWLNKISCNVTKQAIKDCCNAFKRYRKIQSETKIPYTKKKLLYLEKHGKEPTDYDKKAHPKFKTKEHSKVHFYQDPVKIQFTSTHVKLEKITESKKKNRQKLNWVRLAERDRIPVNAHYENPRITFDGESWWISVVCEVETEPLIQEKTTGIGCDLGISRLATYSDGTCSENINRSYKIKNLEKKKKRIQRKISRKYEMNKNGKKYIKTKNIEKCEKKKLHLDRQLTNIRNNYIHQETNRIIGKNPKFICLENLNISGMMSNKHLAKHIQELKWYEFSRQIAYKAKANKISVIFADSFFASSKLCCICGNKKDNLKLKDRIYKCDCGNIIDRDFQAAINLYNYGLRYIS